MQKIDKIINNLYIGSYRAVKRSKELRRNKIKAIVTLMEKNKYHPPPEYEHLFVKIEDKTYIPHDVLKRILDFIDKNIKKGAVLVHCNSGISRSGGVVVAYLLKVHPELTYEQVRKYVRNFHTISPHPNIKQSILDYFEREK